MKLPFWATAFTLLGVIILINLGFWQLDRLKWKNDLIEKIESAYASDTPAPINLYNTDIGFQYGTLSGTFLADKAFLLGPPQIVDDKSGYDLIVPIKTKDFTVLVNMGWTPAPLEEQPIYNLQGEEVSFTGLLRFFSWNAFTPENKPAEDVWYRLDIPLIEASKNIQNLHEAALIADSSNHKFDAQFFDDAHQQRVKKLPNNNHLKYAIFWFTMAGILIIIYILRFIPRKK